MTLAESLTGLSAIHAAPAGDPIGDTLRADMLAYWTMNESSNGSSPVNRADSKNSYDLLEFQPANLIPSVLGLFGNAAKSIDDSSNAGYFYNSNFNVDLSAAGFSVFGWVKFNQYTDINQINIFKLKGTSPGGIFNDKLWAGIQGITDMVMYIEGALTLTTDPLIVNVWHFFSWWEDVSQKKEFLQIDNGTIYSGSYLAANELGVLQAIEALEPSYTNNTDYIIADEVGLLPRIATQDERDYLWNSGAGRALFP